MIALKRLEHLCPTRSAVCVALAVFQIFHAAQGRDFFNPALLELDNPTMKGADLSAFEEGAQAAGTYHVDVIVNDQQVDTRDIAFALSVDSAGEKRLEPCLSVEQLQSYGVRTAQFPALAAADGCARLAAIPQATAEFLFSTQKLRLSIPQAALSPVARGYVSPERWDEGINAVLLNYMLSGASTRANGDGDNSDSQYLNLRPGINIGPWRLRNYTTWNRDSQGRASWDTVYSYARSNIIPLQAQLTLGDSNAPADVFDSMPFRGAQLASDDEMLPESLKGYAPVVRGIARTQAQVVIRQNGYIIYQSYVAPGAFAISDMYATGSAGDLQVTIKEADGSEQNFTVPFASLPLLQREGRLKFAATGGQYRSYDSRVEKTPFGQMTAIYGLPAGFTLYGGFQESSTYQALAGGLGKNLGDIGAISVDVSQSWSHPQDEEKQQGQSWRVRYSKNMVATGTNFAIAGYRYSTSGYYGMQEVLDSWGDAGALNDRRRNRMEATLSQALGERLGALSLSAVREDYWRASTTATSVNAGYSNTWQGISYGLNWTWSKNGGAAGRRVDATSSSEQLFSLNVSVPLQRFLSNSWANYAMNGSRGNGTTHTLGLNGMALEGNALNWSLQQGYGSDGVGYTGNAGADYKGTYGEVTAGYGYDRHSQRFNYGLTGGVVAHADGVTLSQPLGETNVLVAAPGTTGVGVGNQNGVKTDFRGYTVTSNVSPYRKNDIGLDVATLPPDVDLVLTSRTVIPTRGAVVRADYVANVGLRALMTLQRADGRPLPFGAMVSMTGATGNSAIIDEGGQVYLTGLPAQGVLQVVWGAGDRQHCQADYNLAGKETATGIIQTQLICR